MRKIKLFIKSVFMVFVFTLSCQVQAYWTGDSNFIKKEYRGGDDSKFTLAIADANGNKTPVSWSVDTLFGDISLFEMNTYGGWDVGYSYDFSYDFGEGIDVEADGYSNPQLMSRADLNIGARAWVKFKDPGAWLNLWGIGKNSQCSGIDYSLCFGILEALGANADINEEIELPKIDFSLPFLGDNNPLVELEFKNGIYENDYDNINYINLVDIAKNIPALTPVVTPIAELIELKIGVARGIDSTLDIGLDSIEYFKANNQSIGQQRHSDSGVDVSHLADTTLNIDKRHYNIGIQPDIGVGIALYTELEIWGWNVAVYYPLEGAEPPHLIKASIKPESTIVLPSLSLGLDASYVVPSSSAPDLPSNTGQIQIQLTKPTSGNIDGYQGSQKIINCGVNGNVCQVSIDKGSTVSLIAISQSGYTFGSWSGACSGRSNPCSVRGNNNLTVGVNFTDGQAPVVTAPADITKQAATFKSTYTLSELGSASASVHDNIDHNLVATPSPSRTKSFGIGKYSVRWRAVDSQGNVGIAVQKIIIKAPLSPPTSMNPTQGKYTDRVEIRWYFSPNARSYVIARSTSPSGSYSLLPISPYPPISSYPYKDTTGIAGKNYYYKIKACTGKNGDGACSDYSSSKKGFRAVSVVDTEITAPNGINASKGTYDDKVHISWNSVSNADNYKVYRDGSRVSTTSSLYYNDTAVQVGKAYSYQVVACPSSGSCSNKSGESNGYIKIFDIQQIPVNYFVESAKDMCDPSRSSLCKNILIDVSFLHKVLNLDKNLSGINLPEVGLWTSDTDSAVRKFQARYGLSVDGWVGSGTKEKLDIVLARLKIENPTPLPTIENDFYVERATLSDTSINAGDRITASARQYYSGNSTETLYPYLGFYLSDDTNWDNSDTRLGRDESSLKESDIYDSVSGNFEIPSSKDAGQYYILFVADYKKQYNETSENNNVAYKSIVVKEKAENDFYVSNQSINESSVVAGENIGVRAQQHYSGNATSSLSPDMGYYLSSNTTWGSADIYLDEDSSSIPDNDNFDAEYATLTIPANTNTGLYYILFVADHDKDYDETNENNNVKYRPITITSPTSTPLPPNNIHASPGNAKVSLSWNSNGDATYKVYWHTSSNVSKSNHLGSQSVSTNSVNITGLTNGTQYYFVVTAIKNGEESAISTKFNAIPANVIADDPFITTWVTTYPGEEIQIRGLDEFNSETSNYSLDCGAGGVARQSINVSGDGYCDYANAGTHTISISGNFLGFTRSGIDNKNKFKSIVKWGGISWKTMSGAFRNTGNFIIENSAGVPNLSQVQDMGEMFRSSGFNQSINHWDVSNVTGMVAIFMDAANFNHPLNNWNISKVTNMYHMFNRATNFNQPLNNWDVSSVTKMLAMFGGAINFNQPLNNWDVSNVTDMRFMFEGVANFNQSLDNWDVSSVTDMVSMFDSATNFNQPLNNWNVSNVTDMSYIFHNTPFNQPLNSWSVSNVTNMRAMFSRATNFNQSLNSWDVSNVTDMQYMFSGTVSFNQPLNNWNVSNVTNMRAMFGNAANFNQSLNSWNVSNVGIFQDFLKDAKLSTANYDQLLIAWNKLSLIKGSEFHGGHSTYSQLAKSARDNLSSSSGHQWTIADGNLTNVAYYNLVLSATNGKIQSNPIGIDCGNDCEKSYDANTSIELTATPNSGYAFTNWSGSCSSTTNPLTVVMTSDKTCSAMFTFVNTDTDGDGHNNDQDAFPDDPNEWLDTDSDGTGNNADTDDDNDGLPDSWETQYGLDPLNATDAALDADNDGFSNVAEFRASTNPVDASSKPEYTLTINIAENGNISREEVTQEFSLDVDGDGKALVSTDGLLILRFLSNIDASTLNIRGSVGSGSTRTAVEILNYLKEGKEYLDIDGGGRLDVSTDGVLISRFLSDIDASTLNIAGTNASGSTRTAVEMLSYLKTLLPTIERQIQLTAIPNSGYQFDNWSGDCSGSTNPLAVVMTSDKTCSANFSSITISAPNNVSVSNGTYSDKVRINWNGVSSASSYKIYRSASSSGSYSQIAINSSSPYDDTTAIVGTIYYYKLKACTGNNGAGTCSMLSVHNSGQKKPYSLTVDAANNGNITSEVIASHQFRLTAIANNDYQFENWTGDCSGDTSPLIVVMDKNKICSANFVTTPVIGEKSQEVYIQGGNISALPDSTTTLNVKYKTGDNDNTLSGLNIRIHFDSSKLTFAGVSNVVGTRFINASAPTGDVNDDDNDTSTDSYYHLGLGDTNLSWPNQTLPATIFKVAFKVNDSLPVNTTTNINFSSDDGANGYTFKSTSSILTAIDATLDIDGNNKAKGFTDGFLIIRYLLGARGNTLIDGLIAFDATRVTEETIEAYLDANKITLFDVDGNGKAKGFTDGFLIIRYLLGARGNTLIDGLIANDAIRTTASEVEAFLQSRMPSPNGY